MSDCCPCCGSEDYTVEDFEYICCCCGARFNAPDYIDDDDDYY